MEQELKSRNSPKEKGEDGRRFAWKFLRISSFFMLVFLCSGCLSGISPFGKTKSALASVEKSKIREAPQNPELTSSPTGVQEVVELEKPLSGELLSEEAEKFHWVFQTDVRSYRSSNVSRSNTAEDGAAATEYTAVGRLVFPKLKQFSPSLTILGQRAYFGQYSINSSDSTDDSLEALDYEFRSGILETEALLSSDWKVGVSIGYDELLNFRGYDKLYHAVTPAVSIGQDFYLGNNGIINFEVSADYALTKTYRQYIVAGVFDDAGDNLSTSLRLSFAKAFGSAGRLYLTPSASFMRTAYTKPDAVGRVDYLMHAEFSAFYRIMPWLYLRLFSNYQDKTANEKAKSLLEDYAEYENWEAGLGLGASVSF